jgi:hypothetical protein
MRILTAGVVVAMMLFAFPVAAQKAPQTATQFYTEYRDVWQKAKSIDPILPFFAKDSRAEIEATPQDKRQVMFEMMKMMGNMTDVKVVKETKQADGYALDLTAIGADKKPMKGTAQIIIEGGAMKLKKETWTS